MDTFTGFHFSTRYYTDITRRVPRSPLHPLLLYSYASGAPSGVCVCVCVCECMCVRACVRACVCVHRRNQDFCLGAPADATYPAMHQWCKRLKLSWQLGICKRSNSRQSHGWSSQSEIKIAKNIGETCFIPMKVPNELINGVRQLRWQHLSPVVSTFSTSIRLLSSFFIKHCIIPPSFSLCPSICLSSLSVVGLLHPVFLISGISLRIGDVDVIFLQSNVLCS